MTGAPQAHNLHLHSARQALSPPLSVTGREWRVLGHYSNTVRLSVHTLPVGRRRPGATPGTSRAMPFHTSTPCKPPFPSSLAPLPALLIRDRPSYIAAWSVERVILRFTPRLVSHPYHVHAANNGHQSSSLEASNSNAKPLVTSNLGKLSSVSFLSIRQNPLVVPHLFTPSTLI